MYIVILLWLVDRWYSFCFCDLIYTFIKPYNFALFEKFLLLLLFFFSFLVEWVHDEIVMGSEKTNNRGQKQNEESEKKSI